MARSYESKGDISIHAPRGGSDFNAGKLVPIYVDISIHAPRGGSDLPATCKRQREGISIHAPRGGSDPPSGNGTVVGWEFQSTLPAGGATFSNTACNKRHADISIHAPRGGSDPDFHILPP